MDSSYEGSNFTAVIQRGGEILLLSSTVQYNTVIPVTPCIVLCTDSILRLIKGPISHDDWGGTGGD